MRLKEPQTVAALAEFLGCKFVGDPDHLVTGINEIHTVEGGVFLVPKESLERAVSSGNNNLIVFEDAPAARARLRSPILQIDGEKVILRIFATTATGKN